MSTVRKAQVIGALTGAIVTVLLGVVVYSSDARYDPHGFPFTLSDGLWFLLTLPTRLICEALGFGWNLQMGERPIQKIAASLLVNSAVLGLIATPFGWLRKRKSDPGS